MNIASNQSDLDAITTPSELRRAVIAALRERAQIGDQLARGALKVLQHRLSASDAKDVERWRRASRGSRIELNPVGILVDIIDRLILADLPDAPTKEQP